MFSTTVIHTDIRAWSLDFFCLLKCFKKQFYGSYKFQSSCLFFLSFILQMHATENMLRFEKIKYTAQESYENTSVSQYLLSTPACEELTPGVLSSSD